MFRRLLFGTLSRATYSLISVLVTLLLVPFLIRALGAETYGLVVLLGVFTVQGFGGLADLGFASAVTKYCAEHHAVGAGPELHRILGTSFRLYMGIGGATALVVWILGRFALDHLFTVPEGVAPIAGMILLILALGTAVDFAALWLSAVLDGLQRYHIGTALQAGRVLFTAAVVVGVVRLGYGAVGWVSAIAVGNVLTVVACYAYVKRITGWTVSQAVFDRATLRTMWSFSIKVFVSRLTSVAYHTVGRTALGIYRPVGALAAYDVCNKIHAVAVMPMGFTSPMTVPSVSSLQATGRSDAIREFFLRGTLYTVAISLPIAVILMVMAPHVLAEWIGKEFRVYATEVRLFLSYVLLWSLTPVGWNIMIGLNRTETLLPVNLASVGLNVVISLLLARPLGLLGVILGMVIGNLVAVPLYLRVYLRELNVDLGLFFRRVIVRAYPQAVVLGLGLWWAAAAWPPRSLLALGVMCAVAGVAYAGVFWLTGVDAIDKGRFRALFSSAPR